MLAWPVLLGTTSLSETANWWLNAFGDATLPMTGSPITPQDPSSLTLALIGIGTVAIYLAVKRWPRKGGAGATGHLSGQADGRTSKEAAEDIPSRGAA